MNLHPHQQAIVDKNPARLLLAHSTGTGKTITAIALADKNCKTCLVVCLKDGKEKWKREIETYSNKHCTYEVLTKEEFKKLEPSLGVFEGIIVDECHHFGGLKSQLSKTLGRYLKRSDILFRWFLSATPVTATPLSVYVLANHLGSNLNYYRFLRTFFYEVRLGNRTIWKANQKKEKELIEIIEKIGDLVKLDQVVHVPTQEHIVEYFDLSPEQKKAIEGIDEMQHIVRWTKIHQLESGILIGNEYEDTQIYPCPKFNRIVELCTRHEKIAIFARYNGQLEHLMVRLEALGKPIFLINGKTKNREAAIYAAEEAPRAIVLINTGCATGYELPSIGTIVYASLSFSYLEYEQSMGRFLRINRLKENTYYHLVTSGGVDEGVWDCIKNKRDFYIDLYEK